MIPLKNDIPRNTFPLIVLLLILINILLFFHEISLGKSLELFIKNYGVIPVNFFSNKADLFSRGYTLITSIFLHGSWMHLLGNMWFLWIFGKDIEDRLGHLRYIIFYLVCGIAGGLAHIYVNPASAIPTIGASGAISGILGAYFILYPFARILTAVPIFTKSPLFVFAQRKLGGIFFYFIKLPAFFFLGLWFLIQFFSGTSSILTESTSMGEVAWWAHIGGFAAGIILVPFFLIGRKSKTK
ncbi:rhomboid family intramembrane serine protease [bacterium]|nr:rhomboid family intramembrane serine protease [bacterium]